MATQPAPSPQPKSAFWRWHILPTALVLLLFFARSFSPELVLFANDAPLGLVASQAQWPLDNFTGYWQHLHWFGNQQPGAQPNITQALYALIGPAVFGPTTGPVQFSKFYAPLCLLVLGLCAACFSRSMGFSRMTSFLGGLAAMLSTDAFSNACWGLPSWALTWAMTFLALSAIVSKRITKHWMRLPLAGFAVGLGLMEGYDVAAIFSIYVGLFAIWYFSSREDKSGPDQVLKAAAYGVAIAVCAAWMSMVTLTTLVGTQIKGVAQQDSKSSAEKWAFVTSGSLPIKETLRVIIPGLYGYRMDSTDGSQYWGAVNRGEQVQTAVEKALNGTVAEREQAKQALQQLQGNSYAFRHSGSGEYAGVLVVLLAIWAVCQSLRGNQSPFPAGERRIVWFWAVAAVVSLLLAFGRHAPFFQFVYQLPFLSTIRNPIKYMQPFHVSVLILCAFGLEDMVRRHLGKSPAASSFLDHIRNWWAKVGGFDRKWAIGMTAAFGVAIFGLLIFSSSKADLIQYLQLTGFTTEEAPQIAASATREILWFILFFGMSISMSILLISGALGGSRAKFAGFALGLLIVADMSRANSPWIIYENYKQKYQSNPMIDLLRDHAYNHRVAMGPNPGFPALSSFHGSVYHMLWLQHHFPFYNIQSLDIPQEPRVAQEKIDYMGAFATNPARYWQLSNTRYLFGMTQMQTPQGALNYVEMLNAQLDPIQRRFQVRMPFTVSQEGSVISATTNATGPFALIEFAGALPRAKLYSQWQVQTDLSATLTNLASPQFDPAQLVLVNSQVSDQPQAGNTNAGRVEITSYAPKHVTLKAEAGSKCVLLLNDRYHPDWKVWVDGKPAELLRANYIARGVMIDKGSHTVEFKFEPSTRPLMVSLTAIAVAVAICFMVGLGGRKPSVPESSNSGPAPEQPSSNTDAASEKDAAKPASNKRRKGK